LPFPHLNGYATIWNLPDKKEQARPRAANAPNT
jgi:hypothetical protein